MLLDAARRAQRAGDAAALVRAATAIPQFGAVGFVDPMPEGRVVTEAALAALGDEPERRAGPPARRPRLALAVPRRRRGAASWPRRAEAIARDLDDPEVLGAVLLGARHMVSHPRHHRRAHPHRRRARGARPPARPPGDDPRRLATPWRSPTSHRGRPAAWRAEFDRFAELLGDRSLGYFQIQVINHRANRAYLAGDLDRRRGADRRNRAAVDRHRRRPRLRRVDDRRQPPPAGPPRRAGRPVRAGGRALVRRLVPVLPGRRPGAQRPPRRGPRRRWIGSAHEQFPIREIHPWSVAVTELAEAAEVVGDRDGGRPRARRRQRRTPAGSPSAARRPNRPFDQALAQAALTVGDPSAAATYAGRAVAASRHRDTPVFLVRELVFLAEARRRGGDRDGEIRPLVAEARQLAERIGTMVAVADIERYGLPS